MLKNAYVLANIGADTAENEPKFAKNLAKFGNIPDREAREEARLGADARGPAARPRARLRRARLRGGGADLRLS